jgi:aryl-alcohol dehydrogenase-like predicted oxidoreductase
MLTRRLGRSGLEVSALGLGCWAIGGPWKFGDHAAGWGEVDDDDSIRAIHHALDHGLNFFDTAPDYGCGRSERVLGRALAGRREGALIATKFGNEVDEEHHRVRPREAVVAHLRADCEASLRRLNTDYIDLYQFHLGHYPAAKASEVREALEALVTTGKIRWYGWSTDDPECAQLFAEGAHCTAIQHTLNLALDAPQMLSLCEAFDLASVARSPLGSGLLTGKFDAASTFPENDFRYHWDFKGDWPAERLRQVAALRAVLPDDGRTLAQAALAWIWARSQRTLPIPGFKTVAQVRENIAALGFGPLNEAQTRRIDEAMGRRRV